MRYVIINSTNSKVVNVIEYEKELPNQNFPGNENPNLFAIQSDIAQIGWDYINDDFVEPPLPPAPERKIVISKLRFKIELIERGILGQIEAAVNQAGDIPKLYWAEATEFENTHPLVLQVGESLGLDANTINVMFMSAATRDV